MNFFKDNQETPATNSLPRAIAKAMRRRGHAEWKSVAMSIFESLEKGGLDVNRIYLTDAWGEEEDRPFYWDGDGQFTLQYFAKTPEEGEDASRIIGHLLDCMKNEGKLTIEDKGSDGGREPWWWIKATLNDVRLGAQGIATHEEDDQ